MDKKKVKVGILIYTYDRTDDARVNMELIKKLTQDSKVFSVVKMVHAFNGKEEWWPDKYLEDVLVRTENRGHFLGAEGLLNAGMAEFSRNDVDYVIALASDTWFINSDYLGQVISEMEQDGKVLASCAWGRKDLDDIWTIGMGLDFFIIDRNWRGFEHLFPVRYEEFLNKYEDFFLYRDDHAYLERVFTLRYKEAILSVENLKSKNLLRKKAENLLRRLSEREPIHYMKRQGIFGKKEQHRQMFWPQLGLLTHHDPIKKQTDLKKAVEALDIYEADTHLKKFIEAVDVSYFSEHAGVTEWEKN